MVVVSENSYGKLPKMDSFWQIHKFLTGTLVYRLLQGTFKG